MSGRCYNSVVAMEDRNHSECEDIVGAKQMLPKYLNPVAPLHGCTMLICCGMSCRFHHSVAEVVTVSTERSINAIYSSLAYT